SLLAGLMAARIGAPYTLSISGFFCIIGALWFAKTLPALKRDIRPIYVRMGILPPVASGIQKCTELTVPPEN
ncbi:MAG: MFS transporter, partial [Blastocatellia bacterium]|nr:MFS transporter [Blastocatellia bacterium]